MNVLQFVKSLLIFNIPNFMSFMFLKSTYHIVIFFQIVFISSTYARSFIQLLHNFPKKSIVTNCDVVLEKEKNEQKKKIKLFISTYDSTIQNELKKIEFINKKIDLTTKYFHFLVGERIKIEKLRQIASVKKSQKKNLNFFEQIELNNNYEVINKKIKKIYTVYNEVNQLVKEYNIVKSVINNNIRHLKKNKINFINKFVFSENQIKSDFYSANE